MTTPTNTFGIQSFGSTGAYTVCGFFWHDGSTGHNFGVFDFTMGASPNGVGVYFPDTGSAKTVAIANISAGDFNFAQPNIPGRWMFFAYSQRSTTDYTGYLKPVGQPGFTPAQRNKQTATALAITAFQAGTLSFASGDAWPGYMSHVKFWRTRALTEAQLDLESRQLRPAHAGVYSYVPLYNGMRDASGMGNPFTTDGTSTFPQFEPPLPLTIEHQSIRELLLRGCSAVVLLAGRLNARMENFWLRGQRWDSFWIDGEGFGGGTTFDQVIAGTLTSSGALLREARKVLSGTLSSAGALVRQAGKILAGTLSSSGALARQTGKLVAGTLTSSATLVGAKVVLKSLAGTLTSSGTLVKLVATTFAGTLTSAGSLLKETAKLLSGTLSSSGALASAKVVLKSLAGTLTSSATLVRQTGKAIAATLPSAGAVVREIRRALSGTLTSSGALGTVKTFLKSIAGTLTSSGALIRQAGKATAGAFASSGTLVRQTGKLIAGTISGSGALASSRIFLRNVAGTLGLAGTLTSELLANLATWVGLIFDRLLRPQTPQLGGAALGVPYLGSVSLAVPSVQSFSLSVSTFGDVAVSTPRASDVRLVLYGG